MIVVSTTISLCITLGTILFMENRQRVKDRKMSALVVTGSIEQFTRDLEFISNELAYSDTLGTWLLSLTEEEIELLSPEQQSQFMNDVTLVNHLASDKTVERIFSSHIDTWKNMGNFRFVNNVGQSFSMMDMVEKKRNTQVVRLSDLSELIVDYLEKYEGNSILAKHLNDSQMRHNISRIHLWREWLNYIASTLYYLNNQNISLVDISRKELNAFTDELSKEITIKEPISSDIELDIPDLDASNLPSMEYYSNYLDSVKRSQPHR
ncbi:MAG: hypothetical protein Q4D03_00350 [Bacteroidales bacterium]|nr:hypothetical protein [Bacteroidales bacterium]